MAEDFIESINRAYGWYPVDEPTRKTMEEVRDHFKQLAHYVAWVCPLGRERSLALTNLQMAKMWAVQSLVDTSRAEDQDLP